MSKLHSSIQKAIEKSRQAGNRQNADRAKSDSSFLQRKTDEIATELIRIFQSARPKSDVMEESKIVEATDDLVAKSAYKILRTRVLQRMRSNNWNSILVTSPGAGEGKTLTASNLAISLARDLNQTVVLVDLDLMRSSVARYLGINLEIKAGIGDFLLGDAQLSDIIYSPEEFERLALIPNREPVENSSDLLGGPKMKKLLAWLAEQQSENSLVIFDMPPVLACDDVLAFCPMVDAVLLVAAQGKTERVALEQSMKMLSEFEMLGVVFNQSNEPIIESAYGYA